MVEVIWTTTWSTELSFHCSCPSAFHSFPLLSVMPISVGLIREDELLLINPLVQLLKRKQINKIKSSSSFMLLTPYHTSVRLKRKRDVHVKCTPGRPLGLLSCCGFGRSAASQPRRSSCVNVIWLMTHSTSLELAMHPAFTLPPPEDFFGKWKGTHEKYDSSTYEYRH